MERFNHRDDAAGLNTSTGFGTENGNWTQAVDTVFRLRTQQNDTAASTKTANYTFGLEYQINGTGGFAAVTASTPIQSVASAQFNDDDATTSAQLTAGAGTFVNGRGDENAAAPSSGNITLGNGAGHTEIEWALLIDSAQVSNGDTIEVRTTGGNAAAATFPTITVSESTSETITVDEATMAVMVEQAVSADSALTLGAATMAQAVEQAITVTAIKNVAAATLAALTGQAFQTNASLTVDDATLAPASGQAFTVTSVLGVSEATLAALVEQSLALTETLMPSAGAAQPFVGQDFTIGATGEVITIDEATMGAMVEQASPADSTRTEGSATLAAQTGQALSADQTRIEGAATLAALVGQSESANSALSPDSVTFAGFLGQDLVISETATIGGTMAPLVGGALSVITGAGYTRSNRRVGIGFGVGIANQTR